MTIYRIHIRPYGGDATIEKTFNYCLEHNILGCGWRVDGLESTHDWEAYRQPAAEVHGEENLQICTYIKNNIQPNDLVWTRDHQGQYYLAKVISGWEYFVTHINLEEQDIDIGNIFRCDIKQVDIDAVPGKVVACFRPARTIQAIQNETVELYSKYLWNQLSGMNDFYLENQQLDLFSMFDDKETEDIVFLFLQTQGWYVAPHSRQADTMAFEFQLVNPKTNERALVQVKTGNTPLLKDEYRDREEKVFLFQSNEIYQGNDFPNVKCLTRKELSSFIDDSLSWLPRAITNKVKLTKVILNG